MTEYIDRKALIETIKNKPTDLKKFTQYDRYDGAAWRETEILNIINLVPTADVAPVAHGRWLGAPLCGNDNCKCSACGSWHNIHANLRGEITQKYCPNCGARMDGNEQ